MGMTYIASGVIFNATAWMLHFADVSAPDLFRDFALGFLAGAIAAMVKAVVQEFLHFVSRKSTTHFSGRWIVSDQFLVIFGTLLCMLPPLTIKGFARHAHQVDTYRIFYLFGVLVLSIHYLGIAVNHLAAKLAKRPNGSIDG